MSENEQPKQRGKRPGQRVDTQKIGMLSKLFHPSVVTALPDSLTPPSSSLATNIVLARYDDEL